MLPSHLTLTSTPPLKLDMASLVAQKSTQKESVGRAGGRNVKTAMNRLKFKKKVQKNPKTHSKQSRKNNQEQRLAQLRPHLKYIISQELEKLHEKKTISRTPP